MAAKETKKVVKKEAQATAETPRGKANQVVGVVVSDKMNKTIAVEVFRMVRHEKYQKYFRRSTVLKAHDEKEQAKLGDKVMIQETRPLSKTKRWKLMKVVVEAKLQE